MSTSRLPRLRRLLDPHFKTPSEHDSGVVLPHPPGTLKLIAMVASLLVLTGCATTQRQTPVAELAPQSSATDPTAVTTDPTQAGSTAATAPLADATAPNRQATAAPVTLPTSTVIEIIGSPGDDAQLPVIGQPIDALDPQTPVDLSSTQMHADLWARVRSGFGMPNLTSDLVRDHERWYASRPDYVQRMTDRGSRYLFHITEEVHKRHMPTELALLPFIESAFNPQANSVAKASGMWQFIPSTGRDFALKQNVFRDDRRDVLASTRAALDYLGKLHDMFGGDWQLALAAYNWGEGNVRKAITRNQRIGRPTDYESLAMPIETRNYLPKLQAVKNIVASPQAYGLSLPALENHPYFVSVPIQRDIDTALAARLAGLTLDEFGELNPSMKKPVILAAGTPQVLLPYDNADQFVQRLARHNGPMASWTAWVLPRTMTPATAAQQVGMGEAALRDINHIPPRMLVKAGSTLLVPRSERRNEDVSEHLADTAQIMLASDGPNLQRRNIRAGKADTVASLAQRYRLSATQLAQWNHVAPGARLAAGQTLVAYLAVPTGKNRAMARANGKTRVASIRKPSTRIVARRTASVSP
ncbi:MAG: transglycosylase SLT domain-containing protein [Leptothrix sp. (in: b-proteobacteria)]